MGIADDALHRVQRWLKQKRTWARIFLALVFVGELCFFLQFKGAQVDFLELHSVSKQYIVSQSTFDIPNEEQRFLLQQQAIRELGPIYALEYKQIHRAKEDFLAQLVQEPDMRDLFLEVPRDLVRDYFLCFEEYLVNSRFCEEKASAALAAESEWAFLHLFPLEMPPRIPKGFWKEVQTHACPGKGMEPWTLAIMSFFAKQNFMLQQDVGLERRLQEWVKEQVPEQYKQIRKGSFILEPGEVITQQHLKMLQAMKSAYGESQYKTTIPALLGSLSLSLIIGFLTIVYLKMHHEGIFRSLRRLTLLLVIGMMTLFLARMVEYFMVYQGYSLIETMKVPLVVPFASLLICILLGPRIALFCSIFLSVIVSLSISVEYDRFLVFNLLASMSTILFAKGLHRRKDVFEVCAKVWLCCIPVLAAFHLRENTFFDFSMMVDLGTSFASMVLSAIIVVGLLPLFETLFHIMTDMSLMEYMDPNNELLRRLSLEAPGTYQHSLVVGNFAEVAARAIGANHLFCRVAALYHDIGKLSHPHYFTENQLGGFNIHQLLTPSESTQVIISHVTEGELLAKKYRLPKNLVDIIREHHGTTLVYFFYCKQVEQMEGDPSRVNEWQFRYLGPKPRSKEAALLMIADTIEAASRSLEEVTEEVLAEMVDRLVRERSDEGQFDECPISFKELSLVKKAIVKALLLSRHLRVKYPDRLSNSL
ncbi:MAG: HDIG domain-containing protein [Chlamydiae bacterium]|nr:HDIG domain-containing protein [Chlamydiota bacterium]